MRKLFIAAASLAAFDVPAFAQQQPLPPNHPPIDGSAGQMQAPPLKDPNAPLPPNHPKIGGGSAAPSGAAPLPSRTEADLIREMDNTPGLKEQDKPFSVAASLGKLYYGAGRFEDAVAYLKQAQAKGEPARALYLELKKKAQAQKLDLPSAESAGCPSPKDEVQKQVEAIRALAKAGKTANAATCARVAVEPVLEVYRMLGGAQFNTGDAAGAQQSLEKALEAAPDDAEALYLHGSLLLETGGDDVSALKRAKADFAQYLKLRPDGRGAPWVQKLAQRTDDAIAAGGTTKLYEKTATVRAPPPQQAQGPMMQGPMQGAPPAAGGGEMAQVSPEAMQAIQNTERTPELMAGLAKLVEEGEDHLAHGRYQDALDNYRRVVPFEPDNGRAKAGMAWALVGMNRQPMADRVWDVAVSTDPASVDALGKTLQQKGDEKGAKALWSKLAQSAPDYAAQSGLSKRLGQ